MTLIATATFDDEDPDLHVHFTNHARELDEHDPRELVRVLLTFEDALATYAGAVATARAYLEQRLDADQAVRDADLPMRTAHREGSTDA